MCDSDEVTDWFWSVATYIFMIFKTNLLRLFIFIDKIRRSDETLRKLPLHFYLHLLCFRFSNSYPVFFCVCVCVAKCFIFFWSLLFVGDKIWRGNSVKKQHSLRISILSL
jgi:hypothetical protein